MIKPLGIVFLFLFAVAPEAHAFPEMIRHGYVNCTSCHVSPGGGGVLTKYGRRLSNDVLSTWAWEKEGAEIAPGEGPAESDFLYSLVKLPNWLDIGGDVRAVQAYWNTPQATRTRFVFMQGDIEAAVSMNQFTANLSFGKYDAQIQTRRHYIGYRPTNEWSFRLGKFNTVFGIETSDHRLVTKKGLDWDEGSESYNLEAAYLGSEWSLFATVNRGRPDVSAPDHETGLALRPSIFLGNTSQLGLSYFYGADNISSRQVGGPFAIFGFTKRFFLLSEVNFQTKKTTASGETNIGFVQMHRLDYEIIQGLHLYLIQQTSRLDFKNANTAYASYGVGTQFFPRPHFEFSADWQKIKSAQFENTYTDFLQLLLHYYL